MDKMLVGVEGFEWDSGNQEKSLIKHGVSCREAEEVFLNWYLIFPDVIHSSEEEDRFILMGETHVHRQLLVVFTIREKRIRVISARSMNYKERVQYETEKKESIH